MRRLAAVTCVLFLFVACKKDEGADKKPVEKKVEKKPEEKKPEPPKALTGADLLKAYQDCQLGAVNSHDLEKVKTCWVADSTLTMPGMPEAKGTDAIMGALKGFLDAYPDFKVEPVLVMMSGNQVATVVRLSGTNTGSLMGAPPTGKPFAALAIAFDELDDQGKIKSAVHILDAPTMMGQLGMLPKDMKVRALAEPVAAATTVIAADNDTERANLELAKKWGEAMMKGDAKAMGELAADDVVISDMSMPADMKGMKDFGAMMGMMMKAFPDGKWTTVKAFAAGDYVVSLGSFTGTNTGPMPPMVPKATGKSVTSTGAEVLMIQGGKVKQVWWFGNSAEMAMQMGLMPPPGAAPAAAPEKEKGK